MTSLDIMKAGSIAVVLIAYVGGVYRFNKPKWFWGPLSWLAIGLICAWMILGLIHR